MKIQDAHILRVKRTEENFTCFSFSVSCLFYFIYYNFRRRQEREKIGLCGVPDVWGKVHEEEHPQELVICSVLLFQCLAIVSADSPILLCLCGVKKLLTHSVTCSLTHL